MCCGANAGPRTREVVYALLVVGTTPGMCHVCGFEDTNYDAEDEHLQTEIEDIEGAYASDEEDDSYEQQWDAVEERWVRFSAEKQCRDEWL